MWDRSKLKEGCGLARKGHRNKVIVDKKVKFWIRGIPRRPAKPERDIETE